VSKTFLNKKVVNINWTSAKIVVKCEDESEFSADHVILTVPHGILKKCHETLFTPSLPNTKIDAINGLEFGTAGKFFLEFEEKLIPDDVSYYAYLWSEADLTAIRGTDKEW
jgi:monoamine oxidase